MKRISMTLALSSIAIGAVALTPQPPRSCRSPHPANFASGNLYPYINCQAFRDPKWMPTDFHMVSVPIGSEATGYQEFFDAINTILPAPDHQPNDALGGVGPGDAHPGPYTFEMAWGVNDSGFFEGRDLRLSQFRDGYGALVAFMLLPQGTRGEGPDRGSSPDFNFGPIISNDVFPIHLEAATYHKGSVFSAPITFDYPALNALTPPLDVDGASHMPVWYVDNTSFALHPDTPVGFTGVYRYALRLTDAEGRGWNIDVRFVIVQPYQ